MGMGLGLAKQWVLRLKSLVNRNHVLDELICGYCYVLANHRYKNPMIDVAFQRD